MLDRKAVARDEGLLSIIGITTPPVKMSDRASDTTNPFVYVLRALFMQTKQQTKTLNTTTSTDKVLRETR